MRLSPRTEARRSARGFTLLEVLVALVIFALAFGALAQVIQTGFRQSAAAEATVDAALLARSLLAQVGAEVPLTPGETTGEVEDFRWRTEIQVLESEQEDPLFSLYLVRVSVGWGPDEAPRSIVLTTLRTGPLLQ